MVSYENFTCKLCPAYRAGHCTRKAPDGKVSEAKWPKVDPEKDACYEGYLSSTISSRYETK